MQTLIRNKNALVYELSGGIACILNQKEAIVIVNHTSNSRTSSDRLLIVQNQLNMIDIKVLMIDYIIAILN